MKFFVGTAVTGENWDELVSDLKKICNVLTESKHSYYCTLDDGEDFQKKTKREMMEECFEKIDKSDAFLAVVRSDKRSEGMLMEIGYVLAKKKKLILVIKKDVKNTYLRDLADKVIEFTNIDDLIKKMKKLGVKI